MRIHVHILCMYALMCVCMCTCGKNDGTPMLIRRRWWRVKFECKYFVYCNNWQCILVPCSGKSKPRHTVQSGKVSQRFAREAIVDRKCMINSHIPSDIGLTRISFRLRQFNWTFLKLYNIVYIDESHILYYTFSLSQMFSISYFLYSIL